MLTVLRRYKYTATFLFSILVGVLLYTTNTLHTIVSMLDGYGYLSALLAGFLLPFTLTAASAALFLVELGGALNPWAVVVLGGVGGMSADLLLYRFFKEGILEELKLLAVTFIPIHRRKTMEYITKHRAFIWTIPFVASILIASPFPDEIGIGLFGLVNFKPKYLAVLTLFLDLLGVFTLVFIGYSLR